MHFWDFKLTDGGLQCSVQSDHQADAPYNAVRSQTEEVDGWTCLNSIQFHLDGAKS